MNLCIFIGNLGADPVLRQTTSGKPVLNFSIATDRFYYKETETGREKVTETEWHSIVVWGAMATNLKKYLQKGSKVSVTGSLRNRKWEDEEGRTQYRSEIFADDVQFLGKIKSTEEAGE